MIVEQHGAVVGLREVESFAALRGKIRAYEALFGVAPTVTVEGDFTCALTHEAVWLRVARVAKLGRAVVTIELGPEGRAAIDGSDISRVCFFLTRGM